MCKSNVKGHDFDLCKGISFPLAEYTVCVDECKCLGCAPKKIIQWYAKTSSAGQVSHCV